MSERWDGWRFSPHALERMDLMGLRHADLMPILRGPEVDRPCGGKMRPGENRRMMHGRTPDGTPVSIVYADHEHIITVLPWTEDNYVRTG